ncbi:MAG: hypothetical protein ACI90V_005630, partial [Bacillariaceae sp.]
WVKTWYTPPPPLFFLKSEWRGITSTLLEHIY